MKAKSIRPEEIKKGDWLLLVDTGDYESLEEAVCVDNGHVWTKDIVRGQECKESYEEMNDDYKAIYKIEG